MFFQIRKFINILGYSLVCRALSISAVVAGSILLIMCEVVPPRQGSYTCENGTPTSGLPDGSDDIARCAVCDIGYVLENNACRRAAHTCTSGTPAGGNPSASADFELCASCFKGYILENGLCRQPRYTCGSGAAADGSPDGADSDVELCASCSTGYVKDGIVCRLPIYTCASGAAADGSPDGADSDVELCVRCASGYQLNTTDNTCSNDLDGDGILNSMDIDDDNDGLIEIHNLTMLRNIRYNLAGTTYDNEDDDSAGNEGTTLGARAASDGKTENCDTPTDNNVYLCGYELTRDLDFAEETDYFSGYESGIWRPNNNSNPSLATNEGWRGIGDNDTGFSAIFEGNGYTISNLYRNTSDVARRSLYGGLFNTTAPQAHIRNIGVVDAVINTPDSGTTSIGGLVGSNRGTITASYATGTINGASGENDAGGLVGFNSGTIIRSYATSNVDAAAGNDRAGGLVGNNSSGMIINCYASGTIDGYADDNSIGGLVGLNEGVIIASYATGTVNGGDNQDAAGGLVGRNSRTIIASYAIGGANGNDGDDSVGGLVGFNTNIITASYATGIANGNNNNDNVGGLVGLNSDTATITASYGFRTPENGSIFNERPDGFTATELTLQISNGSMAETYAGDAWNNAGDDTADAWDVGNDMQAPVLRYADYDGNETDYDCDIYPSTIDCGTTLLPGQVR